MLFPDEQNHEAVEPSRRELSSREPSSREPSGRFPLEGHLPLKPESGWMDLLGDPRLQAVLTSAREATLLADEEGNVVFANVPAEALFGRQPGEVVGHPLANLISPEDRQSLAECLETRLPRDGAVTQRDLHLDAITATGELLPVELCTTSGVLDGSFFHCCVVRNLQEVRLSQARLQRLADHDSLTGLYNRRRFYQEVKQHIRLSERYGTPGSLLFFDLDDFKEINDTLGHAAGDEVLRKVSEVLRQRVRKTDIVGRLGGDEFAVLLTQTESDRALDVAKGICDAVRKTSIRTQDREVSVTASLGVASFPLHARHARDLFANADLAMYGSKARGRNCATLFDEDIRNTRTGDVRILWEERIRRALNQDDFFLMLQAISPLRPGLYPKYESLIRMRSLEGGVLPPGDFLPIAERYGLIVDIDRWVFSRVVKGLADSPAGQFPSVTVNLSARALGHQDIFSDLREASQGTLDTSRVTLEITESAVIADYDQAREFLEDVRSLGYRLAIDDFGTGFSSLARLRELNADYLKVAMPFVLGVDKSVQDQHLVRAIVSMAQGLGQRTIAEGVETQAVLTTLGDLGVDYAQGFFIERPTGREAF